MKKILPLLAIVISFNALAVEEFPVEHFFKEPLMLAPTLSPDGEDKKIARVRFIFAMLPEGTLLLYTSLIRIKTAKQEITQLVQVHE